MAYSTIDDIENVLPERDIIALTDDEDINPGSIEPGNPGHSDIIARVNDAIAGADSEIDAYCSNKYSVPFVPVPAIINTISVNIAVYNLYSRREEEIPPTRQTRYENAINLLIKISEGTLTIGDSTQDSISNTADTQLNDRLFTRTSMQGF